MRLSKIRLGLPRTITNKAWRNAVVMHNVIAVPVKTKPGKKK